MGGVFKNELGPKMNLGVQIWTSRFKYELACSNMSLVTWNIRWYAVADECPNMSRHSGIFMGAGRKYGVRARDESTYKNGKLVHHEKSAPRQKATNGVVRSKHHPRKSGTIRPIVKISVPLGSTLPKGEFQAPITDWKKEINEAKSKLRKTPPPSPKIINPKHLSGKPTPHEVQETKNKLIPVSANTRSQAVKKGNQTRKINKSANNLVGQTLIGATAEFRYVPKNYNKKTEEDWPNKWLSWQFVKQKRWLLRKRLIKKYLLF